MKKGAILVLLFFSFFVPILIYLNLGFLWDYNTQLWYETGKLADEQGPLNVYWIESGMHEQFNSGYFAFPPPWLGISQVTYSAAEAIHENIGFPYLIRLIPLICLLLTNYLVFVYFRAKHGDFFAAGSTFMYSVVFGVVNWFVLISHGQMDAIPVFFTMLALILAMNRKLDYALFSLGIGAAFKLYPIAIALAFMAREKKDLTLASLLKYTLLSFGPLFLVSLPYLLTDATSYLQALTQYSLWAGFASSYAWIYLALGIPSYLGNAGISFTSSQQTIVILLTIISLFVTSAGMLIAYIKIIKRKINYVETTLLPLMTILAFWKFVDVNFVAWALPFAFIDAAENAKRLAAIIWIFTAFYLTILLFSQGISILMPITQITAIVYYIDLIRR